MKKTIALMMLLTLLLCACGAQTAPTQAAPVAPPDEMREAAASAAPTEAPAEPTPASAPAPTTRPADAAPETPKPAVSAAPTEAPAEPTPVSTAAVPVTAAPTELPAPTDAPVPATEPPATEAPAETAAPADLKSIANSYVNQSVGALYAAIGYPVSSDYAPSCLGPGEDGNLYYEGFTVYTYRENGVEKIRIVE